MKKKLLLLFLFFAQFLLAQNPVADSLTLLLKNASHDTVKLRLLVELSEQCDETEILTYAKPAVTLADELLNKLPAPVGKFKEELLHKKAAALNNIGFMYNNLGQAKEALNYLYKGLKIQQAINDKRGTANSLNNIGIIYKIQGQLNEALVTYGQSLKIQQQINNKLGVAYCLNNMGTIYQAQGRINQALDNYRQSIKILEELKDKRAVALSLNNIGTIYNDHKQQKEALVYYSKSLKIFEDLKNKRGIAIALNHIGNVYFKQHNNALALTYVTQSLAMCKKAGFIENIRNAEQLLAQIDSVTGNGIGAFTHYKQYIIYRDSMVNTETRKASIKKQIQYEFEKKELATQSAQDKLDALHAEEKQKQRIIIYAIIGLLALVLVFAVFMYNRFRITNRQKTIIEKQKQLVDNAYEQLHEKNKEVMDSIYYARRIQNALITPEKYIAASLNKLIKNK